jgi:hypothetical protein
MYPVHDVDAILLLSLSVAAKRRPAELVEIITAIEMMELAIPSETKLSDAFARVSAYGLIVEIDGGYTLSADAQAMMENQRKKDDTPKKIYLLKEHLADYHLKGEHATILVSTDQIATAVAAHQAEKKTASRNMQITKPKPKTDWVSKRDLLRGAVIPPQRRKPKA